MTKHHLCTNLRISRDKKNGNVHSEGIYLILWNGNEYIFGLHGIYYTNTHTLCICHELVGTIDNQTDRSGKLYSDIK